MFINQMLKNLNKNIKIYKDIFFSLQILMNEIMKENYKQHYSLFDIIQKLPKYIILNEDLLKMITNNYNQSGNKNSFTTNSLVSFYEYFEYLCWEDFKKYILQDYKITLDDNIKNYIFSYFENNKNNKEIIINKNNLANAIRKLLSRYIIGTRQDVECKPENKLIFYISRYDLWNNTEYTSNSFEKEINEIFKKDITIGQSLDLYNSLIKNENKFEIRNKIDVDYIKTISVGTNNENFENKKRNERENKKENQIENPGNWGRNESKNKVNNRINNRNKTDMIINRNRGHNEIKFEGNESRNQSCSISSFCVIY